MTGTDRGAHRNGPGSGISLPRLGPRSMEREDRAPAPEAPLVTPVTTGDGAARSRFEAAFEHALDAILIGVGPVFTDANPAACALVGLPREQVVGRAFSDFHRPRDEAELGRLWRTLLEEGAVRGEIDVVRGDGALRHVEFAATANIQPGVHLSILRDVTERKKREVMSQRYELLSRHARDIVLFIDPAGTIVEANDAAVAAYGYSRDELLGLDIRALRAEGTRELVAAQMDEAFARGLLFETMHRRRDGSTFPVEIGSRSALIGSEVMLLSIVRDVTERAEMAANLLHADRLAAVGTLAAGVAHEINNPLAYAMGNLDMLARRLPEVIARLEAARDAAGPGAAGELGALVAELADAERMLDVAREGASRVRHIVTDLRRFSRADEALVGAVDVHEVLEYSIGIAGNEIRHRARIVREYGDVPEVAINESRLGQVFLNVLVNAAQAIPEGNAEDNQIRVRTSTGARGRVVVEIVDTGVGIPPHLLGRVFDPFLTTKPVGEGTGLGLFVSRSIIKVAGGEISVESEVGHGTTVRIVLPAATGPGPASAVPSTARSTGIYAPTRPTPRPPSLPGVPDTTRDADASGRRSRLLVIDDEPALAVVVYGLLAGEHDVIVVASGREALARLATDADFDVILCDLMMPDLAGTELFENRRRAPPRPRRALRVHERRRLHPPRRAAARALPHPLPAEALRRRDAAARGRRGGAPATRLEPPPWPRPREIPTPAPRPPRASCASRAPSRRARSCPSAPTPRSPRRTWRPASPPSSRTTPTSPSTCPRSTSPSCARCPIWRAPWPWPRARPAATTRSGRSSPRAAPCDARCARRRWPSSRPACSPRATSPGSRPSAARPTWAPTARRWPLSSSARSRTSRASRPSARTRSRAPPRWASRCARTSSPGARRASPAPPG